MTYKLSPSFGSPPPFNNLLSFFLENKITIYFCFKQDLGDTESQSISFNRNYIRLWTNKQVHFFSQAIKIYGKHFPRANFCPVIYRQISLNYYVLVTNQKPEEFEKKFPFNQLWQNAGFGM